jgi:hypothetical protein
VEIVPDTAIKWFKKIWKPLERKQVNIENVF